ncbi:hypothetical protein OC835_000356 [Tilletia horrida]|nr:hypothetical protein OC835_000356 [Tilletia horrida]
MRLTDAIELMRAHKLSGQEGAVYIKDYHLFRQERQLARKRQSMAIPSDAENNMSRAEPQSPQQLYEPPFPFRDDWMNNIREAKDGEEPDDFAFCYAGSVGSSTNLHRDVYTSYSWSTNVVGRKRWRLFPPSCVSMLRRKWWNQRRYARHNVKLNAYLGPLPVSERPTTKAFRTYAHQSSQAAATIWMSDTPKVSSGQFQKAKTAGHSGATSDPRPAGETIFVPSNWYHEVLNLTDCISINHNWCNSYNLESMYDSMVEEVSAVREDSRFSPSQHTYHKLMLTSALILLDKVEDVEASLEDVRSMLQERDISTSLSSSPDWQREWVGIVQQVARQDAGWAWEGFWDMVEHNLRSPPTEVSTPLANAGTE